MAADKYMAMSCQQCGGQLFYDEKAKHWRCKYCGTFANVYEDKNNDIKGIVRQVLLDIARGDLEKARKGLSDCEKRNHTNVGTLIARICVNMDGYLSSEGTEQRTYISNMRADMESFWTNYRKLGPEQTKLFESFGEDSADAFAQLLYVFDFMQLNEHVDFCLKKLNASKVRSPKINSRLLKTAVKRGLTDLIDQILSNSAHIDHPDALVQILESFGAADEESEKLKAEFVSRIADKESIEPIYGRSPQYFNEYFVKTNDPVSVRTELLRAIQNTEVMLDISSVWNSFSDQVEDPDRIDDLMDILLSKPVSNTDLQTILSTALTHEGTSKDYMCKVVSFMNERQLYASVNSKVFLDFLARTDISGSEKKAVLECFQTYPVSNDVRNAVLRGYLCETAESDPDDRKAIIEWLLGYVPAVSTQAVEQYVLECTLDGSKKPEIVQMIIDHDFKPAYAGNLLGNYISHCPDDEKTEDKVFNILKNAGFQMDPRLLNEYISKHASNSEDPGEAPSGMSQQEVVQRSMDAGTSPLPDALDNYLSSLQDPNEFNPELVNIFSSSSFYLRASTYGYYLLRMQDPARTQHNRLFVSHIQDEPLNSIRITVNVGGVKNELSLLQTYLVTSRDSYEVMASVVSDLMSVGLNIKDDILENGSRVKFKKFVKAMESQLSPQCLQVCRDNKLFSFF